ncbi:flagellar transcriptional regulator FlhD [Burkholderia vietnamiensis]|nr:flagellar transcriptional regulator FlhD [Burkholderia vietnamiensis]
MKRRLNPGRIGQADHDITNCTTNYFEMVLIRRQPRRSAACIRTPERHLPTRRNADPSTSRACYREGAMMEQGDICRALEALDPAYLELMQQMLKIDCDVAARELGISNEIASLIIALKPAELEALVERLTQARPAAPVPSP